MTVSNPGSWEATNVKVTDNMPDGLQYVSSNPAWTGQRTDGDVEHRHAAGGRAEDHHGLCQGDPLRRVLQPGRGVADMCGWRATRQACTTVCAPALAVVQAAPACWLACECAVIKNVVTNTGQGTAYNVQGTTQLPAGLTTADGKTSVPFNAGNLAPGQSKEQIIQVKTDRTGTFTSRIGVSADGGLTAEASTNTTARQPVLQVTGTAPETRFVGKQLRYDFTVTNRGDIAATNTKLVVTLPKNATFNNGSEGVKNDSTRLMWDLGTIDCNASKQVCFVVTPTCQGDLTAEGTATTACSTAQGQATSKIRGRLRHPDGSRGLRRPDRGRLQRDLHRHRDQPGQHCRHQRSRDGDAAEGDDLRVGQRRDEGEGRRPDVTFEPINSLGGKQTATYKIMAKVNAPGDARIKVALQSDQIKTPVEKNESTTTYK